MRCPHNPDFWFSEKHEEDPRWADHLASCPSCRADADRANRLHSLLTSLPQQAAPAELTARMQSLAASTDGQCLECAEVLDLLEPYREGDLEPGQAFLVEDHLLWCASCAEALATADQLTTVLRDLPLLTPPDAILERITVARLPWWQRLWTAPAPSWNLGRLLTVSGAVACAALLFAVMLQKPVKNGSDVAVVPSGSSVTNNINPDVADQGQQSAPDSAKPNDTPVAPENMANGIAVTGPARTIEPARTQNVVPHRPVSTEHQDRYDERMPRQMAKVLPVLAAMRPAPAVAIPLRGGVEEIPVVATVNDNKNVPLPSTPPPPTPEKSYNMSARDALLAMNRDDDLARNEEELSSVPDNLKGALLASRPDVRYAAMTAAPVASTDDVNQVLDAIKRQNSGVSMGPIGIKNEQPEGKGAGVLFVTGI